MCRTLGVFFGVVFPSRGVDLPDIAVVCLPLFSKNTRTLSRQLNVGLWHEVNAPAPPRFRPQSKCMLHPETAAAACVHQDLFTPAQVVVNARRPPCPPYDVPQKVRDKCSPSQFCYLCSNLQVTQWRPWLTRSTVRSYFTSTLQWGLHAPVEPPRSSAASSTPLTVRLDA